MSESKKRSEMFRHSFYERKRIKILIFRINRKDCNFLPVFGFNSAVDDNKLMKRYLLPLLDNERGIGPIVIKKANQFVSLKFGDVRLIDNSNLLGGATTLDSFLKAYKTSLTKMYFPIERFNDPEKLNNIQLPPYGTFIIKQCNSDIPSKRTFQNFKV